MRVASLSKPLGRIAVAAAAVVSFLTFAEKPALAGTDGNCWATSDSPFMIDPKIHLLDGEVNSGCDRRALAIRVEATLELYSTRAQQWVPVAEGDRTWEHAQRGSADAFYDCLGTPGAYRTRGRGTAVFQYIASRQPIAEPSAWKEFACSNGGVPLIRP